jgi:hypothetical protein
MESATSEGKTKPLDKAVLDRINPVTSSLWLHFNEHYLNVLVLEKSGQELIFETGFSDIWNQNPGTILAEISQQAPPQVQFLPGPSTALFPTTLFQEEMPVYCRISSRKTKILKRQKKDWGFPN